MNPVLPLVLLVGGLAVGVTALITLHVLPTGLSPVHDAVSHYGVTGYRLGYRVQTLAYAVAGLGAALGVSRLPGSVVPVIVLCAVFAAARAAISWFPMDVPGGARTATGRSHGLLAVCAFVSVGLASRQLSELLKADHLDPGIRGIGALVGLVMALALVGMIVVRRIGADVFGLVERAFYVGMTLWLATVAVVVARH